MNFRYGKSHIESCLKQKISYRLKPSLLKQETEYDEIYEDTWGARENEWLPHVKNDVLSTVFCYARYLMGMEEIKMFRMKNS